jgi:APA family basic amino acid/polyamine antiporter
VTITDVSSTRLARRLGLFDAVVIGLGSMIGAGVFAAIGPAAEVAGSGLLVGLGCAAVVAYCNATSSARLAAVYPQSGGTYVYGREQLGSFWGYLAGWGFIVGKTASCAAMALTFGAYASPEWQRPLAVIAVITLTTVNHRGVRKTAGLTRLIVVVVLASLAATTIAVLGGGQVSLDGLGPLTAGGWLGIVRSGGLLFFAFAGYARIATLGEEVIDPARTIPRAIPIALGITLAVYTVVASAALLVVGPDALAASEVPSGSLAWLSPAVRIGAAIATLGVLLSLIAGLSRTGFAMAARGDLPRWLDAVHPTHRVPHVAQLTAGAVIVVLVCVADIRGVIGFSSFTVLAYYAITNASAWRLPSKTRRRDHPLAALGVCGCAILAVTLPKASVVGGLSALAIGAAIWFIRRRSSAEPRTQLRRRTSAADLRRHRRDPVPRSHRRDPATPSGPSS